MIREWVRNAGKWLSAIFAGVFNFLFGRSRPAPLSGGFTDRGGRIVECGGNRVQNMVK